MEAFPAGDYLTGRNHEVKRMEGFMGSSPSESASLNAEDFFRGLIAALGVHGQNRLGASQPDFHRAFHRIIKELRRPEVRNELTVDLLGVDYDPLYGLSGWFDRALTRAQRDLLVSFPNPSYDLIEIAVKKDEGEKILSQLGHEGLFLRLADLFRRTATEPAVGP